jgi:GT2 family glycosyltransferase
MAAELTVQVVNYRTREHLGPCLRSVLAALAATDVAARVAVLDNGSGDDLSELAGELAGAVEFHASDENLGFGAGHNLLAARHDSPLLCFVNPDVVADQADVFARLLDALRDGGVAVAGPLLRTPDGAPQRFDHGELRGVRARVANGAGHAHWRPRAERTEVAWVSGAFLLVRRSAFDAVGGFDEGFFLYKEEEDLCLRIRRAGGRVLYVPDAQARHVGGVVAGRDPAQLAASVARYRAKHCPGRRRRVLDVLYTHVTRRV